MRRKLQLFVMLACLTFSHAAAAADLLVDGVPLPSGVSVAGDPSEGSLKQWSGAWVGLWGDSLKHILLVEAIDKDGTVHAVYAAGDNPYSGTTGRWLRVEGKVSGHTLTVTGKSFSATYEMTAGGDLKAHFARGDSTSTAEMTRIEPAALLKPGAVVPWTRGKSEFLQTGLTEDGKPVKLEAVIFRPPGAGPFPLAVINHGSTGRGTNPALFTQTWFSTGLADFLNDRGWIVAFPQRRGRGKSDGLYDEGFAENRTFGYTCEIETTMRGADRALGDIDAAIAVLRRRQDVASGPLLIGGVSRGGILSIAYAGLHPVQVAGVINFVGGWLGDGCPTAATVNHSLFERGATFPKPTIWLYGQHDRFYSMAHSRGNFAAFEHAGGRGQFLEFDMPFGQGHSLAGRPDLWTGPIGDYLGALSAAEKNKGRP